MSVSAATKARALTMVQDIYNEIKDKPGSRVDRGDQHVSVKGYWCGPVLRIDTKFKEARADEQ